MRRLILLFSVICICIFVTACQPEKEENNVVTEEELVLMVTPFNQIPSPTLSTVATKETVTTCAPSPTPYCHGDYDEVGSFCVYIQQFCAEEDYIVVRPVEWIIPKDEMRIEELGLDLERDLICGYYIRDWGFSEMKIPITEDTEYHFIDYWHEYTEIEKQGLCTITKEEEIFIGNWEKYTSMMTEYPFFVELNEDGTLKLISEKVTP